MEEETKVNPYENVNDKFNNIANSDQKDRRQESQEDPMAYEKTTAANSSAKQNKFNSGVKAHNFYNQDQMDNDSKQDQAYDTQEDIEE